MLKYFKGISGKIIQGYILILSVFILIAGILYIQSKQNIASDIQLTRAYFPLLLNLNKLQTTFDNTERLTDNWINQPTKGDRDKLINIINTTYPSLKKEIKTNLTSVKINSLQEDEIIELLKKNDNLLQYINEIVKLLAKDEDYADDRKIDDANLILTKIINPDMKLMNEKLAYLIEKQQSIINESMFHKTERYQTFMLILILGFVLYLLITIYISFNTSQKIVLPLKNLDRIIHSLSKGEINSSISLENVSSKDEIGQMIYDTKQLVDGMNQNTKFAKEIGKGNYNMPFSPLSEVDELGISLITMRDDLKSNAQKEGQIKWINEGLTLLEDKIRKSNVFDAEYFRTLLVFTVKYSEFNQGGLFIINDEDESETHLELVACYAYDKVKKGIYKKIELNDGLLGECVISKEVIYINEIPDQFLEITSGLGHKTPSCLLLVPLTINDTVYGAMELASFSEIEAYKIEFLKKVGEVIASTFSNYKSNIKTTQLLEKLKYQSENLQNIEDNMRQTIEELTNSNTFLMENEKRLLEELELLRSKG